MEIRTEGEKTIVKCYETDVVKFTEGRVWLDNGGFFTDTTKRCMNKVSKEFGLGYHVRQSNGHWLVKKNDVEMYMDTGILEFNI